MSLSEAMMTLMKVFDKYASSDDDKECLSRQEVKTLLKNEMPGLLEGAKNQEEVDKILGSLDLNRDDKVDFCEFMFVVTGIVCAFYNRLSVKK